ncbi:RNA polymerase sigma factor [uncultured Eubacterium sp.]|uniref:RNA polymerase sigma factor n=1 Tax=uncultured Eubacterium sp. TaxID=165185 RepID=UPI000E99A087|nr:RNA polymerase sigma factor [uncultured Eubacterium sp.]HAV90759.1 RNA polymerase sigma factor [Eubacterium sp.]
MNNDERRQDVENTIREYSDLLFRTCFLMLKNRHDVEDVMQETFIKYMTKNPKLDSEAHKRAWLLRVSQNKCKNLLRFHRMHMHVSYENMQENLASKEKIDNEYFEEFMKISRLDFKYKSVIMLYYAEGYSIEEVADILQISISAVKMRMKRAKEKLKVIYEKDLKKEVGVNVI